MPELAQRVGDRFDHVLVDEYQDTNALQAAILLGAEAGRRGPHGGRRRRAGDLLASAPPTVRNILDFPSQFAPPAAVVTLEQNYRSTQPILDAAQRGDRRLPASASPRTCAPTGHPAEKPRLVTVQDDAAQADCVVDAVLEHREAGTALKEQAVLFRTVASQRRAGDRARPAQHPVRQVRRAQVPRGGARQGRAGGAALGREPARPRGGLSRAAAAAGRRPGDRRQGARPHGRHARRFEASPRYRPPATAADLLDGFRRPDGGPARRCRRLAGGIRAGAPAGISRSWSSATRTPWCAPAISTSCERIAAGYPRASASSPSSRSIRRARPATRPARRCLDEDYLILSTIHSAKGQEWKAVFVLNVVDGCIPSDMATGTPRRSRRSAACSMSR